MRFIIASSSLSLRFLFLKTCPALRSRYEPVVLGSVTFFPELNNFNNKTKRWFERLGYDPSEEVFKFRRGQYFSHMRAAFGHATALAVARSTRVAEHDLRRNRSSLHTHDGLLHPPTTPVAF